MTELIENAINGINLTLNFLITQIFNFFAFFTSNSFGIIFTIILVIIMIISFLISLDKNNDFEIVNDDDDDDDDE